MSSRETGSVGIMHEGLLFPGVYWPKRFLGMTTLCVASASLKSQLIYEQRHICSKIICTLSSDVVQHMT